jgi:hypothetical protein
MNSFFAVIFLFLLTSCTTIHFRSKNTIPVSFEGNPKHQKEVSIVGHKNFYFWGFEPEEEVVYIDDEVREAGYEALSKLIIYEHKDPQDTLIQFLTFGFYVPRGYTITGYTSGSLLPEELDEAPQKQINN